MRYYGMIGAGPLAAIGNAWLQRTRLHELVAAGHQRAAFGIPLVVAEPLSLVYVMHRSGFRRPMAGGRRRPRYVLIMDSTPCH